MRFRTCHWAAAVCLVLSVSSAQADVALHPLFTPGAVLQQGREIPVWGTAAAGEQVTVTLGETKAQATADAQGHWMARLAPQTAGGPHELVVEGNNRLAVGEVLIGEVWLASGQSNMQWSVKASADPEATIAAANHPQLRLLTVPRQGQEEIQTTAEISWTPCTPESVPEFSAVAYHFGRHLQAALKCPVGLINTSYGGTPAEAWTTREKLLQIPELRGLVSEGDAELGRLAHAQRAYQAARAAWDAAPAETRGPAPQPPRAAGHPHRPSVLYNAMIHPLVPYAIRGAIWYQGESNAGRAYQYRTLFPAMISSWREVWEQGDFPFLFVQLAPFMKKVEQPEPSAWAELREAQWMTTQRLTQTGMAVITDVGDENDIHPKAKEPVGQRLALAARALAYGEAIEYSGPEFHWAEALGPEMVLHFRHAGQGLKAEGDALTGFVICGADRRFVNATARIEGAAVVVRSDEVPRPVAVRYGWANYPLGNLWNADGLPATPFRTDDFPASTAP